MIIYKITNKINGLVYIGQTRASMAKRWYSHCNTTQCRVINRAINKYGKENFTIEEIDGANSLSELNYLEQHYIWIFNSLAPNGYNLMTGGHNPSVTDETRKKLSDIAKKRVQSPESNEKRRKTQTGVKRGPMSEKQKKQLSEYRTGKPGWSKGKPKSEETKKKISLKKKEDAARDGYVNPFFGKKHSEETKLKMRKPKKKTLESQEIK